MCVRACVRACVRVLFDVQMSVDDDRTGLEKKLSVDQNKVDLVEIASPHTLPVDSVQQL